MCAAAMQSHADRRARYAIFRRGIHATAAEILREHGIHVLLSQGATPTPAIAYEIRRRKIDGAINFTASHNPAEYQGLKFSGPDGGPALPEVTHDIEARAAKLGERAPAKPNDKPFEKIDPRESYLERLVATRKFQSDCATRN